MEQALTREKGVYYYIKFLDEERLRLLEDKIADLEARVKTLEDLEKLHFDSIKNITNTFLVLSIFQCIAWVVMFILAYIGGILP